MSRIPVAIEAFGKTDPGQLRENNEDSFLVANMHRTLVVDQTSVDIGDNPRLDGNTQGTLLLVADGMGGESAGDRASRMAIETLANYVLNGMPWYYQLDERHGPDLVTVLREGVARCEAAIQEYQRKTGTEGRMGTTFTLAYILWPNLYIAHAGDSRCYLMRTSKLRQLTKDHTIAQLMVDQGQTEELDDEHYGHVLWNAVGADINTPVKPQVGKHELTYGDHLLLCSDGLYGLVSDERITQLMLAPSSAEEACTRLINEANESGGHDNVTVIVARFRAGEVNDDEPTIEQSVDDDEPTAML